MYTIEVAISVEEAFFMMEQKEILRLSEGASGLWMNQIIARKSLRDISLARDDRLDDLSVGVTSLAGCAASGGDSASRIGKSG